jgi:hypothetical protein
MASTPSDAEALLASVPGEARRSDAVTLAGLMGAITGDPPALWPGRIVGFGRYHYRYASGREGDAPLAAFSPRRQHLVVYFARGLSGFDAELARLGRHQTGKGCLYLKRLADVDLDVLRAMIERSVSDARRSALG